MHVLSRFSLGAIVLAVAALLAVAADAACLRHVAQDRPLLMPAAFGVGAVSPGQVGITYVGHASFLIETAGGVKIVTDYNDHVRAPLTPDIVTMNNAHSTHYSMIVEPGVVHALQGWGNEAGPVVHDLPYKDVQVRKWFDPSLPPIRGDRAQLTQVFLNLVKNAFQAMDSGTFTVTTRLETDYHIRERGTGPNRLIWVDLADQGRGIREEDLPHIFSPFFSTRNNGTGLGLATCYRIIREHGGTIRVESTEGKGSTFRVSLVVAD